MGLETQPGLQHKIRIRIRSSHRTPRRFALLFSGQAAEPVVPPSGNQFVFRRIAGSGAGSGHGWVTGKHDASGRRAALRAQASACEALHHLGRSIRGVSLAINQPLGRALRPALVEERRILGRPHAPLAAFATALPNERPR